MTIWILLEPLKFKLTDSRFERLKIKFTKGVFEIGVCGQTLAGRFKIQGNLRFLSHAETVRLICRALVRADVPLRYSEGFNPRPGLSLPLPRSVGVAGDDELFCASIYRRDDKHGDCCASFESDISSRFPADCELISVEIFDGRISPKAVGANYYFPVKPEPTDETLRRNIEDLNQNIAADEPLVVERTIDEKGRTRQIDVRNFLVSANLDSCGVIVKCTISNAGTIRPMEILKLLKLDNSALTGAIRRYSVQWEI